MNPQDNIQIEKSTRKCLNGDGKRSVYVYPDMAVRIWPDCQLGSQGKIWQSKYFFGLAVGTKFWQSIKKKMAVGTKCWQSGKKWLLLSFTFTYTVACKVWVRYMCKCMDNMYKSRTFLILVLNRTAKVLFNSSFFFFHSQTWITSCSITPLSLLPSAITEILLS